VLQMNGGSLQSHGRGPAIIVGLLAVAAASGAIVWLGTDSVPVILAVLVGCVALLKPAWGFVGYLVLTATLPSSQGVSRAEIACFGLLFWLFAIASLKMLHNPPAYRYAKQVIAAVYVLMAVIGANWLVAWGRGIDFTDWARDVVPLSNLVMLIVLPTFITHEKDVRALRTIFTGIIVYIGLAGVLSLSAGIIPGLPQLWNPLTVGGTWLPVLLVAAAAAGISVAAKGKWLYLGMGALGVAIAVFTPTRTIWVGVLSVILVSSALNLRAGHRYLRRNVALVLFLALTAGGLLQFWRSTGNTNTWVGQENRFQTLGDLSEDQSVDIRKRQVQEALFQFSSSPFFGVGLGHQYLYQIEYTDRYEGATNYNHSDIANTLCKMGLIGTLAVYTLLIMAVVLSGRLRRQGIDDKDRWFGAMAQIALVAALIMGNSCPVLQERGATFLVGLLIGLVVAIAASNDRTVRATALRDAPAEAWQTEQLTPRVGMAANDR